MIENLYNSKINIIRVTTAPDSMGGQAESETTLHNNLPCRINWSRGSEKIIFGRTAYYRDAKVYCSVKDITVKDRVVYSSKTYEIVDVSNPDNVNKYMILDVKLIE
ncbi:hypothetical protein LCGC14_2670520 [marine sediment metagenome]|uniref:Phage head-tail adaptor n=1 Tax=marine sediment metagenome TaxID=412755 RepID=A0A0F9ABN2_9ZZZZ